MELVVDEIDMLIVTYTYLGSDWQLTNFCMSWKYCTRINFAAINNFDMPMPFQIPPSTICIQHGSGKSAKNSGVMLHRW
jgi:hypothetical protein